MNRNPEGQRTTHLRAQPFDPAPRQTSLCRDFLENGQGAARLERVSASRHGIVYRGQCPELDRTVALNVMQPESPERLADWQTAVSTVARLRHPAIARIYDAGIAGPTPFVCREFVRGLSLEAVLGFLAGRPDSTTTALTQVGAALAGWPKRLEFALELAEAVLQIHAHGVFHGSLRPDHLVVTPAGRPKIVDFRLVMPAKCIPGGPEADLRCLGLILYELFALEKPALPMVTRGRTSDLGFAPLPAVSGVPRQLDRVIRACLGESGLEPYRSLEPLVEDLRRVRAWRPILAQPIRLSERLGLWSRRHLRCWRRSGTA